MEPRPRLGRLQKKPPGAHRVDIALARLWVDVPDQHYPLPAALRRAAPVNGTMPMPDPKVIATFASPARNHPAGQVATPGSPSRT